MADQENEIRTYAQMLQDGLDEVVAGEPFRRFLRFLANNPNYFLWNVLLIGRGRGRRGRATAKPTDSRRASADSFAVKMARTKAGGRGCQILFPIFGGEMATAKIQTIKDVEMEIFRILCKKYYSALDGLDRRNGDRARIVLSEKMCYTFLREWRLKQIISTGVCITVG